MDIGTAIGVPIGLIFIYFVLSLICTSVNEAIAGVLRLRARVLFSELDRILDDERVREAFWNSGLVRSLSRKRAEGDGGSAASAPSYIASDAFAVALIQALRNAGPETDNPMPDAALDADLLARKGIGTDSMLGEVLRTLTDGTKQSGDELKTAIGAWFDQVMERATGVYKRYMNLMTFLVAATIVVGLDADTIEIVKVLWQDDVVRSHLVQAGIEASDAGDANPEEFATLARSVLSLPLGWDGQVTSYPEKAFGLLLTTFALALGAPFWFDLLSRFVAVRNSGPLGKN